MSVKLVRISGKVHRPLAIQAAREGVTISSIAERAIEQELIRLKGESKRKRKSKAETVSVTSDGSQDGA